MGLYATTTSFTNLIPYYLKGNLAASDTSGVAIIDAHITRAESIVNAYLGGRYSIPFSTVPPIVRVLSEDVATWYLIRGSYVQDGQKKNIHQENYEETMDILKEIRDGKVPLTLTDGSLIAPRTTNRFKSSTENYTPIFQLDDSEDWDVDDAQMDDIEDSRE